MAIVISGVNNNDKITASDGTIDLLSGVNYVGVITAPSITASNNITAASINVGSNIQLGNAGVATATTFVGNLTGNVNATSNLLLQIGGSEKFRVASSGQLGIGGANYGTSGQVLTSGGSGSAATWSTITGTTINNNAANRVITGEGGTTLNGEANLTYDGTTLKIGGDSGVSGTWGLEVYNTDTSNNQGKAVFAGNQGAEIRLQDTVSGETVRIAANGQASFYSEKAGDPMVFYTKPSGGSNTERLRITSDGKIGINNDTPLHVVHIKSAMASSPSYIHMTSTGSNVNGGGGGIAFDTSATNTDETKFIATIAGIRNTDGNGSNDLVFSTTKMSVNGGAPTEKLRITSEGYVTKPQHPSFCARWQSGDGYVSTNIFRLTGINNDNFTWNTGGHYSTSTGKFTAPVAGVYFFEGQAMTTGHSNNNNIQDMMELRTNNGLVTYCRQRRTYFRSEDDANGYFVNGTSGQVNLAVGDTVWFQRRSGLSYGFSNSHYTYFTGWLIG